MGPTAVCGNLSEPGLAWDGEIGAWSEIRWMMKKRGVVGELKWLFVVVPFPWLFYT